MPVVVGVVLKGISVGLGRGGGDWLGLGDDGEGGGISIVGVTVPLIKTLAKVSFRNTVVRSIIGVDCGGSGELGKKPPNDGGLWGKSMPKLAHAAAVVVGWMTHAAGSSKLPRLNEFDSSVRSTS